MAGLRGTVSANQWKGSKQRIINAAPIFPKTSRPITHKHIHHVRLDVRVV